jgi:holo-ACP synthase
VTAGPAAVTLHQVLRNRERRVLLQSAALEAFGRPVISITLVNPGPVKDTPAARQVMDYALRALEALTADRGWSLLKREVRLDPTGPEALLVVNAGARELKQATVRLEEEHPLGRLWDLDVIDPLQGAITRSTLGLPARRCLLCGEDAHVCVRSRAHPLNELQRAIEEIIHAYSGS